MDTTPKSLSPKGYYPEGVRILPRKPFFLYPDKSLPYTTILRIFYWILSYNPYPKGNNILFLSPLSKRLQTSLQRLQKRYEKSSYTPKRLVPLTPSGYNVPLYPYTPKGYRILPLRDTTPIPRKATYPYTPEGRSFSG